MAKKFQIRDETFGLALYEAETAREALLDFVADHARGEARPTVVAREDGSAELVYAGVRYSAVPTEEAPHVHVWADKALLNEPTLKVCACGASMTDREYRDGVVERIDAILVEDS